MYEGKCPFFKWIDRILGIGSDNNNYGNDQSKN